MGELTLKVVTPECSYGPFLCDSVHITVSDDSKEKGKGSYGIRPGHTNALFSLDTGHIKAFKNQGIVFDGIGAAGFATVENDLVTVVTEVFSKI